MRTHARTHTPVPKLHHSVAKTLHTQPPKLNTSFENTPLHVKTASAVHTATVSSGGSILRTVIGLVIVIAVIYGLTWIVRKLKAKDAPAVGGDGLERVATLALGNNKSVALVRVGNELHLLGVGDQSVTGIRSFTEDEAIDLGLPVAPPGTGVTGHGASPSISFLSSLGSFSGGGALDSLRKMTQR